MATEGGIKHLSLISSLKIVTLWDRHLPKRLLYELSILKAGMLK